MGLFTSNADSLYDTLVHSPRIAELQKAARLDVAAAACALARVESNFKPGATGDVVNGVVNAWGWWQINSRVWSVDTATVLDDADYQISLFAQVWRQAEGAVTDVLDLLRQRHDDAEVIGFAPAVDLPQLYNTAWQFGAGAIKAWTENWSDWSAKGFIDYRAFIGSPIDSVLYTKRAADFRTEYLQRVANAPDFWNAVVVQTVKDAATIPTNAVVSAASSAGKAIGDAKQAAQDALGNAAAHAKDFASGVSSGFTGTLASFFASVKKALLFYAIGSVLILVAFVGVLYLFRKEAAEVATGALAAKGAV